jgi:hypothetical protein
MTHPDDLLAAYVDGSLAHDERAGVDAHLATCDRCREEVALAGSARRALASLPRTVPIPDAVGTPALDEARRGQRSQPSRAVDHPRWARWAGPVAGAAAVIVAIAIAIPALTGGGGGDGLRASDDAAAEGAVAPAAAPASRIERIGGDLDATDLPALVEPVRGMEAVVPSADAGPGTTASTPPDQGFAEATIAPADVDAATACLRTAFPPIVSAPLRVVQLRFEQTPAYAGVYFVPAGDGVDVDTYQVVVASRSDCSVLSSSAVRA